MALGIPQNRMKMLRDTMARLMLAVLVALSAPFAFATPSSTALPCHGAGAGEAGDLPAVSDGHGSAGAGHDPYRDGTANTPLATANATAATTTSHANSPDHGAVACAKHCLSMGLAPSQNLLYLPNITGSPGPSPASQLRSIDRIPPERPPRPTL